MTGLAPVVHAQVNGVDALFVADSGAFFSSVTPAAVEELHLRLDPSIQGLSVEGVGGRELAAVARARTFTFVGKTFENVDFVVVGSSSGGRVVGLIGQNVFHIADVEYDLANGVIRIVQPRDCRKDTPLAYWAAEAHEPYSVVDIESATLREPHTKGVAYLNGAKIRVIFDTGAGLSLLTLDAAKRAGITPASEGVIAGGSSWGIGHRVAKTWIARFGSFKIGDEEILHAQLRFGDVSLLGADMLIGADFFLSHRIYVASSQRRLYFTYNGGPVFDLAQTRTPPAESPGDGTGPGSASAGDGVGASAATEPGHAEVSTRLDLPTDAAGFARRGAASAARHDYGAAIKDLTRACELSPAESSFFYQRGMVYGQSGHADLALADFDHAIRLKPDDVDALVARASLHAGRHDPPALTVADLDAADRALAQEADVRMRIGSLYIAAEQPAAAVVQYSKWIDSHPRDDLHMAAALNARCWGRALVGQALDLALADCNAALRMRPNTAAFLNSRGCVYLRQSNYDKAIADYDAALHLRPNTAWSLYGRGLARLHKGMRSEGQADLDAAIALEPGIAEEARTYGIT